MLSAGAFGIARIGGRNWSAQGSRLEAICGAEFLQVKQFARVQAGGAAVDTRRAGQSVDAEAYLNRILKQAARVQRCRHGFLHAAVQESENPGCTLTA